MAKPTRVEIKRAGGEDDNLEVESFEDLYFKIASASVTPSAQFIAVYFENESGEYERDRIHLL